MYLEYLKNKRFKFRMRKIQVLKILMKMRKNSILITKTRFQIFNKRFVIKYYKNLIKQITIIFFDLFQNLLLNTK